MTTSSIEFCSLLDAQVDFRSYDIVIIGGGMLGSILASSLYGVESEIPPKILILQDGGLPFNEHYASSVPTRTPPELEKLWNTSRDSLEFPGLIRSLGGRSIAWGGWCPKPIESELREWPQEVRADLFSSYLNESSELLGVNSIVTQSDHLHCYLRSLVYSSLRTSDNTFLLAVNSELELDAPLAVDKGTGKIYCAVPAIRKSLARALAQDCTRLQDRRLVAVHDARVIGISTEGGLLRTIKLQFGAGENRKNEAHISLKESCQVAVALGAIESTRLILNSLSNGGLGASACPLVGKNLIGHILTEVTIKIPNARLMFSGMRLGTSALLVRGKYKDRHFHIQIKAAKSGEHNIGSPLHLQTGGSRISADGVNDSNSIVIFLAGVGEIGGDRSASSTNRVELDSQDMCEFPRAKVTFQPNQQDLELWDCMDSAITDLIAAFTINSGFEYRLSSGEWVPKESPTVDLRTFRAPFVVHDSGCLWMGNSSDSSVTTSDGIFYGIPNLFISGSATFPTIGSHNGTLTAVALTRRMARKMRDNYFATFKSPRSFIPISPQL